MIHRCRKSFAGSATPRRSLAALGFVAILAAARPAFPQDFATPTVGDNPTALQLCRRAEDLRETNPLESARLVQRVLGELGDRLVAVDGDPDRFAPAEQRMLALLRSSPRVMEAWRESMAPTIARLRDEGDLETLARVAPLAPEGAEAIVRLAQRDLEAGRAASVLARLEALDPSALPDARARAFALAMRARAAALAASPERADAARRELQALAAAEPAAAPIAAALEPATSDAAPIAASGPSADDARSWPRIWRLPLPHAPFSRRYLNPIDGPLLTVPTAAQALEDGSLLTVAPRVDGDRVYLSEGHVISAIDRLSRRVRWRRNLAPAEDLEVAPLADLSEITAVGDTLIVLTGHGAERRRTGGGRVVALDRETGATRWERSLAALEPPDLDGSDGLFPHGAAVVVDDTVIVLARKVYARQESVATLVGLDLATGRPRWMTYLAGCGGRPMSNMRAFSDPVVHDGAIFVASSIGATARVDPASGAIRWLVRSPVPVTDLSQPPLPWENGSPVATPAGLLAITPDQSSVSLLDLDSGKTLRTIPLGRGEAWGQPNYLVAGEGGREFLAVGDDVALFRADALDRPLWRLSAVPAEGQEPRSSKALRGRVSFAEGSVDGRRAVVVPFADRVLLVDAESGRTLRRIDTGRAGNPVLSHGQLLLAGADRIECFMPFHAAERAVRDWMERDPRDATRALALLELGIQGGDAAMIEEGAATASAALDRADDDAVRSEVVSRILAGAVGETQLGEAEARRLLVNAGRTARRASDRVACALAEGDWNQRRGRLEDAVDAWQRVLSEPELRVAEIAGADSMVPARSLAFSRMASAVAANAPQALVGRERAAEASLRALGGSPRSEALLEHASAWIGTASGSEAAVKASAALASEGSPREAFIVLAEALRQRSRLAGFDASTRDLLAALAASGREHSWQASAAAEALALLDRAGRSPGASQETTSAILDAIRALQPTNPSVRALPSIGAEATSGQQKPMRLALLSPGADAERPLDAVLVAERPERPGPRGILSLRSGPSLEPRWSAPIDVEDPEVLAWGDEIVLWQRGSGVEPSLLALSAKDGTPRWAIPSAADLFDRARIGGAGVVGRRPLREHRFLSPQELAPIRADPWIVVVRRNGDIACIDRRDGSVRWRRDGVSDDFVGDLVGRVGQVAANGMIVAVGGARRISEAVSIPVITVLDAETGRTLTTTELPVGGEVDWVTIAPGPLVIAGVRNSIVAIQPGVAMPLWTRTDHRLGGGAPLLTVRDSLLLAAPRSTRREEIVSISLLDGAVDADHWVVPARRSFGSPRLIAAQRLEDGVVVGFTDRVILFDLQGRTVGQDAVASEHGYSHVLPSRDLLVAVDPSRSFVSAPDRSGASPSTAVLYMLSRREGGRLVAEPIALPVGDQSADRWILIDGAVVGSGLDWCTSVPLGPESPR